MTALKRFYTKYEHKYKVKHITAKTDHIGHITKQIDLTDCYNRMCDKQLQPIVILTKVDLITEADIEGRLSDVYDSGVIDVYITEFCKNSTIPR